MFAIFSAEFKYTEDNEALIVATTGKFDDFISIEDAHAFKQKYITKKIQDGGESIHRVPFNLLRDFGRDDGWLVKISIYNKVSKDEYVLHSTCLKVVNYGINKNAPAQHGDTP